MARPRSSRFFAVGVAGLAALLLSVALSAGPAGARDAKIGISARVNGDVDRGAVSLVAACNRGCTSVRATGSIRGPGSIGQVALSPSLKRLKGGKATLELRIPASVRSRVDAALGRGEKVTASLRVVGLDAAGRALVSAAGRVRLGS